MIPAGSIRICGRRLGFEPWLDKITRHVCYGILQVPIDCCSRQYSPMRTTYHSLSNRMKFVNGPSDLLSGRCHPTKILPASEKVFKPAVVTHDPVNYPPPTADDLSRQQHDEMQETTELHPEQLHTPLVTGHQKSIQGFQ